MARERARSNSSLSAAAAGTDTEKWRKARYSLSPNIGRFWGTTRTFRDPIKVDHDIWRRFSSGNYSSRVAGATRTFRDPAVNVDLFGSSKTTGTGESQSSTGGENSSSDACRRYITTQQEGTSEPTAAGGEKLCGTTGHTTRNSRRASLHEWLATKTPTSLKYTGQQWSELLDESIGDALLDGDSLLHDEEQHQERDAGVDEVDEVEPPHDSPRGAIGCDAGVDEVDELGLPHSSRSAIDSTLLEHHTRNRGDDNDNVVSSTRSVLETKSTDDQLLNVEQGATAGIKDIYGNTIGDGVSRRVPFLSGTMGLTVDIDDPMQPQPPGELYSEQQPASPCSGVILETSPRYGSLQTFRKEMSSRGVDAQARIS